MNISEAKLRKIIREEFQKELEEGGMASRAASAFQRVMGVGVIQKAIAKIKDSLDKQGAAGSPARKEEVISLLNQLGIGTADLMKIMGAAKGEERAAAAAQKTTSPEPAPKM